MSVIVNPSRKLIALPFSYVEQKTDFGSVARPIQYLNKIKGAVVTAMTYWKPLTWGEHVSIVARSFGSDGLDTVKYRDMKLKTTLKRIVDGEEIVSITPEIIDNMEADVVDSMINLYEQKVDVSADQLDNLAKIAKAFFEGKKTDDYVPPCVYESMLAERYGWTPEVMEEMDYVEFQSHLRVCVSREEVEKDFQLTLAGAKDRTASSSLPPSHRPVVNKKFDPNTGMFI